MATIHKCDLCGKEIVQDKYGEKRSPLIKEYFEVPNQEYSAWSSELCEDCDRDLLKAIAKAKYDFWKSRKAEERKS